MAFTEAQKVEIRAYLGYPDVFQDGNYRLESVFDVLGARADAQAKAEAIMADIVLAATKFASVLTRAGIRKADEVEFFDRSSGSAFEDAQRVGRMHVGRLSILFGVPVQGDYFGERGYQGTITGNMNGSASGGLIPLG